MNKQTYTDDTLRFMTVIIIIGQRNTTLHENNKNDTKSLGTGNFDKCRDGVSIRTDSNSILITHLTNIPTVFSL